MLNIDNIFESIRGEGINTGIPSTFIRLSGCNFADHPCVWCDTSECQKIGRGTDMTIPKIVEKVWLLNHHHIVITGGEPLVQETELLSLCTCLDGYEKEIETNGSIIPSEISAFKDTIWSVDMKCPSSGNIKYNNYGWLDFLSERDQLKFVIKDRHDFDYANLIIKSYNTKTWLVFSPVWNTKSSKRWSTRFPKLLETQLASWINNIPRARLSMQFHKLIGATQ